jgi:hypothetical protein
MSAISVDEGDAFVQDGNIDELVGDEKSLHYQFTKHLKNDRNKLTITYKPAIGYTRC